MSCGVGHRLGSDPELLAAVALIQPLAREPLYVRCSALKKKSTKTKGLATCLHCSPNSSMMAKWYHHLPGFEQTFKGITLDLALVLISPNQSSGFVRQLQLQLDP